MHGSALEAKRIYPVGIELFGINTLKQRCDRHDPHRALKAHGKDILFRCNKHADLKYIYRAEYKRLFERLDQQ